MKVVICLAINVLVILATMASMVLFKKKKKKKMDGRGVVRTGKGIILVISNEDMDDFIRIIKS